MSKQILRRTAAGVCAGIVIACAAAPAQAYQCKGYPHQAVGVRAVEVIAKLAARKGWETTARASYGTSWSLWSIAKAKSMTCARLNTGKWRCLASAKPCNFVVP